MSHQKRKTYSARLKYRELEQESRKRERAEAALRTISEGTASVTGGDFFRSLVCYLASIFSVKYAFVTECTDENNTSVRTLALLKNGIFQDNVEYPLAGTPCERVLQGEICYYPRDLAQLFPVEAGMESYLGVPVRGLSGAILGHLCVMDMRPMQREPHDFSILHIFAARAGAELERQRTEDALRQREAQLRHLNECLEEKVHARTHEIERRRQVAERLRDMITFINSNRSLDEILDYIVGEAMCLLGACSGAIYRLDDKQQMFVIQMARGIPREHVARLTFPAADTFLGHALQSRQPIVIADLAAACRAASNPHPPPWSAPLSSYQSLLTVPLIRQGAADSDNETQTYGGIALHYTDKHQLSEEEMGLAVAFADQATLAIENARLRQRVKHSAVLEERGRLARELHDSVTQSLYSLTLLAEGWRRMAVMGRLQDAAEPLTELGEIAQQSLKEMRLLVHELRPPELAQAGLLGALHERLGAVERRAGVEARLLADDIIDLPAPLEEGLYRIAQEALNNALKHAHATSITVHLRLSEQQHIELDIIDNGQGFDRASISHHGGMGLASMHERAARLGGLLHIDTAPGQGTSIKVRIAQHTLGDKQPDDQEHPHSHCR